jgi:hypothetical protein
MMIGSAISRVRSITDSDKLGREGEKPNREGEAGVEEEAAALGERENNKLLIPFLGIWLLSGMFSELSCNLNVAGFVFR